MPEGEYEPSGKKNNILPLPVNAAWCMNPAILNVIPRLHDNNKGKTNSLINKINKALPRESKQLPPSSTLCLLVYLIWR